MNLQDPRLLWHASVALEHDHWEEERTDTSSDWMDSADDLNLSAEILADSDSDHEKDDTDPSEESTEANSPSPPRDLADLVSQYFHEMGAVPLLSRERELFLFRNLFRTRSRQAKVLGRLRFCFDKLVSAAEAMLSQGESELFEVGSELDVNRSASLQRQLLSRFRAKVRPTLEEMALLEKRMRVQKGSVKARGLRRMAREHQRLQVRLGRLWLEFMPTEKLRTLVFEDLKRAFNNASARHEKSTKASTRLTRRRTKESSERTSQRRFESFKP